MSTHLPGFQSFFRSFGIVFVLTELATSSIRVNCLYSARTYVTDLHSTLGSGKSGIICPLHGGKDCFYGRFASMSTAY